MSEKESLPVVVEKKQSFWEKFMQFFNRTTVLTDKNGKEKYISYPPKKGFSKKEKSNSTAIKIQDMTIAGEARGQLGTLENLEKITFGRDVLVIARDSILGSAKAIEFEEREFLIPEGAISSSRITEITGPGVHLSINNPYKDGSSWGYSPRYPNVDIYREQDEFHMVVKGSFSLGEEGHYTQEQRSAIARNRAKALIESSSAGQNDKSIYVYDPSLLYEWSHNFTVHAITGQFPMPKDTIKDFKDEALVALYITGVEELDLLNLYDYPNLANIIIGADVKRVLGDENFPKSKSKDSKDRDNFVTLAPNGKDQRILFLSNSTEASGRVVKHFITQEQPTIEKNKADKQKDKKEPVEREIGD